MPGREGGREGQFITVHDCQWNNSNSYSVMHCLCWYVLPNLLSPLPVYIARTVRLKLQKEIYIENFTQEYDIYLFTCSLCPLSTQNLILPRSETTRHSIKVHWRYCIKWDIHICHRKSPKDKGKVLQLMSHSCVDKNAHIAHLKRTTVLLS